MERGSTRSGGRFAKRNQPHHATLRELLQRHPKLLSPEPSVSTQLFRLGRAGAWRGRDLTLVQTAVRFPADHPDPSGFLRQVFLDLFREHTIDPASADDGFEVVTTFNAVLSNAQGTSFSVFYGHDYRADNFSGAAPELRAGSPVMVRSLADVSKIPTKFDLEALASSHRQQFEKSGVRIERILNVVHLIYRLASPLPSSQGAGASK